MKNYSVPFSLALAVLLSSGCGQNNPPTPAAAPSGPRTVEITASDTMKYDVSSIEAKPGEQLTIVLTNAGTMPIESMGHNWVLLKAGSDVAAFDTAAIQAKDTGYIPLSLQDEIVAQIPLLGPRKSGEIAFTVPAAPGEYPYLCTFPAHFQVGMHGVLVVK
jgi:azurin